MSGVRPLGRRRPQGPTRAPCSPRRPRRAFTLVELIVALLVLAVLAAIVVVGYTQFTHRSRVTAVQANLRQISTAVLAYTTAHELTDFDRTDVLAALKDADVQIVDAGPNAAGWTFYGPHHTPASMSEFAVGFDDGPGTDVVADHGTRLILVTSAGDTQYGTALSADDAAVSIVKVEPGHLPGEVLDDGSVEVPPAALTAPQVTSDVDQVSGLATFTWTAVTGATGYVTQYALDGGAWQEATTTELTTQLHLDPAVQVLWRVAAQNSAGARTWSDALILTRAASAPTLTGTLTGAMSSITWPAVTGATSYAVRYQLHDTTGASDWVDAITTSPAATYTTLGQGQAITWQVAARSAAGTGEYSTAVTHTRPAVPVISVGPMGDQMTVTWEPAFGATSYTAQWSDITLQGQGGHVSTTGTSVIVAVPAGYTLNFRVRTEGTDGFSTWADASLARVPAVPQVSATRTDVTATATWAAVPGATSYQVSYQVDNGSWVTSTTTATTASATTSEGSTITWKVAATNAAGTSDYSTPVPLEWALTVPAPVAGTSTTSSVTWTWPSIGAAGGYEVRYSTDGGSTWSDPTATSATSATKSGLTTGVAVLVQVRAKTAAGVYSAWSTAVVATSTMPTPTGVHWLGADSGSASTWTLAMGATCTGDARLQWRSMTGSLYGTWPQTWVTMDAGSTRTGTFTLVAGAGKVHAWTQVRCVNPTSGATSSLTESALYNLTSPGTTMGTLAYTHDTTTLEGGGSVFFTGWVYPRSAATVSVPIEVNIDNGAKVYTVWADEQRPDVGAAFAGVGNYHGYALHVPAGVGTHQIKLTALNFGSTADAVLYNGTLAVK